jgi:2-haloacid dehalogenase
VATSRRTVLTLGSMALLASASSPLGAATDVAKAGIAGFAFDAFTIFDPRPITAACEREFPGHGSQLATLWRARQFEYQWLRALGGEYANFWRCTEAALEFAARSLDLRLLSPARDALMTEYLRLRAWPDVAPALSALRKAGKRLALLSNATQEILQAGLRNSDLHLAFDEVISTDEIRTYKPDPRAYELGQQKLRLRKEHIMFVAFAGWDAAGAKWFGYPTFWNNRQNAVAEQLDASIDASGPTLADLLATVRA